MTWAKLMLLVLVAYTYLQFPSVSDEAMPTYAKINSVTTEPVYFEVVASLLTFLNWFKLLGTLNLLQVKKTFHHCLL